MVLWEPGTQYNYGDIVEYQGHRYKIIEPHRSQGDWTPDVTPALWGRLQDGDHGFGGGEYRPPKPEAPPNFSYGHDSANNEKPVFEPHPEQQVPISHEETKKHWYDLDDDRKKELEIGGGLLAGVAAIGAGYYAYNHHKKSEEEKKALTWGLQTWLQDAQRRKDEFYRNGPRAPVTWVLTQDLDIPRGALKVGHDDQGNPLFAARAFHDGGIHIGYVSPAGHKGAVISYGGETFEANKYEVLLGDPNAVHWERLNGSFRPQNFVNPPIDGGYESNKTPIAVARVDHHGWRIPGKASAAVAQGANFAFKGEEKFTGEYEILVLNRQGGY